MIIPRRALSCIKSLVALALFLVPVAVAGHPFIVRASTRSTKYVVGGSTMSPNIHCPTSSCSSTPSTCSSRLISLAATALRGGSDDVTVSGEESEKVAAKADVETKSEAAAEASDAAAETDEADDELSVEATDEEIAPPSALDGDAVSISADAFIHPAHVGDDDGAASPIDVDDDGDRAEEEDEDERNIENENEAYFSAVEDEDEGSTTPVTPDDEDIVVEAPGGEVPVVATDDDASADDADVDVATVTFDVDANQGIASADATEEPSVVDFVEEAEFSRQQQGGGGYTEDDSAAYVDRMDLADDEGEEVIVDTTEEAVAESIVAANTIVDAEEDDDVDPLDLGLARSTREELQRQQQAKVAAVTEAAAAATAEDAPPTVQYMITRNMKRVLADELGYTEEEVKFMKPDVAAVLTSKRLKRPSGGMPDAFYVDGKAPSASKNRLGRLLKSKVVQRVVLPALIIGSSAYIAAIGIQPGTAGDRKQKSSPAPATVIPAVVEDGASAAESHESSKGADEEQLEESRLGAFRPGRGSRVPFDLDDTFLDKMITRMLEKLRF